jgi:hypothetical protein
MRTELKNYSLTVRKSQIFECSRHSFRASLLEAGRYSIENDSAVNSNSVRKDLFLGADIG